MATLLAVTPSHLSNTFLLVADMRAGAFDAAMLLNSETSKPYALLALATDKTIEMLKFASDGRKNFVYQDKPFNPAELTMTNLFKSPRAMVCRFSSGESFVLASPDCAAFFNVHYPNSKVWKESNLENPHKFTLKSGDLASKPLLPEDADSRKALLRKSAYLTHQRMI